jgi:hypothetical protein
MTKYYVGRAKGLFYGDVFTSTSTPTHDSHGVKYISVTGPFRTKKGAMFMAECGLNNPHCRTVSEAEKLAKTHTRVKKGDWRYNE